MDEKSCNYFFSTDTSMRDGGGRFSPAAYLRIVETALEAHMTVLELDVPRLVKKFGVTWVLLSISFAMRRAVRPNERVRVQTWATHRKGAIYRREIRIFGDDDTVIADAASFYALLDLRARRICMDKAVMAEIDLPEGEALLEAESRMPFAAEEFAFLETRRVRPSWIDAIGHMNNSRYAELAYDALTQEERGKLDALARLEFFFLSELKQDDTVRIVRQTLSGGVAVAGVRERDEKPSFLVRFFFS